MVNSVSPVHHLKYSRWVFIGLCRILLALSNHYRLNFKKLIPFFLDASDVKK